MNDLIGRQAAIDALVGITMFKTKHELMQRVNASIQDEQGWLGAVAECLDEIEDLPSAQPEIIRCKDCKYWYAGENINYCRKFWDDDGEPKLYRCTADDFCSRAERKEL